MPRSRNETPDERATRRTRVTAHDAIEDRALTDHIFEVPEHHQAEDRVWTLTHVAHTRGHAVCELCGHNPIRRLFYITNRRNGRQMLIGSECARSYVPEELVDTYMRRLVRAQNIDRRRAERRERAERIQRRRDQLAQERATQRDRWRAENRDVLMWLRGYTGSDRFILSLVQQAARDEWLTDRQTEAVRTNMQRAGTITSAQLADSSERERRADGTLIRSVPDPRPDPSTTPATSDECTTIRNGRHAVVSGGVERTFLIHTVQTGRLAGKRIIKRERVGQTPRWQGFASLSQDGHLILWSRFRNDSQQPYVHAAGEMLEVLMGRLANGGSVFTVRRQCARCNRQATDRLCTQCAPTPTGGVYARRGITSTYDEMRQEASRPQRATAPPEPALSELGTGEEL